MLPLMIHRPSAALPTCAALLLIAVPLTGVAGSKAKASAEKPSGEKGKNPHVPFEMETHALILLERGPKADSIPEAELQEIQRQHLAHLDKLASEGKILVAGPFADQTDDSLRGACVYSVPVAEALELANADPAVKAGRLKVTAMTWWTGKGYMTFPKAAPKSGE